MGELFDRLSERAKLERKVGPHMARRAFGSNAADAGGSWDEVHLLLGQEHPGSVAPYVIPDAAGYARLSSGLFRRGSCLGEVSDDGAGAVHWRTGPG
ncbi:hypothetical protein ACIBAH_32670 [Streptomyces sp. NPDC051445]|uniref:hypothetical protein n=1 Tax=Streptomyces sp. NPDC051445 TaxID=3365653 RepID=UPI0037A4B93B